MAAARSARPFGATLWVPPAVEGFVYQMSEKTAWASSTRRVPKWVHGRPETLVF